MGIPFSRFTTTTRSTDLGKFSKDCESPQNLQVKACAGIGFPHCSQSFVIRKQCLAVPVFENEWIAHIRGVGLELILFE
jgi:hypothetical protein